MNYMFDNAAACRPFPWAAELFAEKSLELFANQESSGKLGTVSANAVKAAEEQISAAAAPGYGVLFCNTGTDAIRAAVCAALSGKQNPRSLTTKGEHPSLLRILEEKTQTQYCRLSRKGKIQILPDSVPHLFAVHHVNSETGVIQNPEELKKQLPEQTVFLLDTTQSFCKIPVPGTVPDFLTVSGCKIGAPCGAALLYRKTFEKQVLSLRQKDHGIGRCVPAAAAVLGEVVSRGIADLERNRKNAEKLRKLLRESLSELPVEFTADTEDSSPWIVHFLLPGYQGGILVRMLNERGITAAAGSACSSETPEPSAVLLAMGYSSAEAYSALRISFSPCNTEEEILFFANTLHDLLKNY